jgi:hypothetical protein
MRIFPKAITNAIICHQTQGSVLAGTSSLDMPFDYCRNRGRVSGHVAGRHPRQLLG